MSYTISSHIPKALPSLTGLSEQRTRKSHVLKKATSSRIIEKPLQRLSMVGGAILGTVYEHPALAVTGVNHEEDLTSILIQSGIVAFFYFIVMPPIIMNWLRIRWYRRKLLETYLQFMFVFIFYPGVVLWAPFLNFRKFPRDPDMKYPWDKPKDPSKIKNAYLKYPFADPDDYA